MHCLRATDVAEMLKRSIFRNSKIPERQNFGWTAEGRKHWAKEMFPDGINEIYVSDEYDEENVSGGNCESYEEEF